VFLPKRSYTADSTSHLIVEPETQASNRVRQLFQQVQRTVANASKQQRIIELIEKVLIYIK